MDKQFYKALAAASFSSFLAARGSAGPDDTVIAPPDDRLRAALGASPTTDDILHEMAETFKERNEVYGNNYKMVAPIMKILFPDGVPEGLVFTDQFHLFELIIVKLTRFAISELLHKDSIHDAAVYAAMIESIISKLENEA